MRQSSRLRAIEVGHNSMGLACRVITLGGIRREASALHWVGWRGLPAENAGETSLGSSKVVMAHKDGVGQKILMGMIQEAGNIKDGNRQ